MNGVIVMKLMDGFDSNYRYVLVAARRARQREPRRRPMRHACMHEYEP